jgi:leader peptidase (prepilin peptidase) / N-methyltransferase
MIDPALFWMTTTMALLLGSLIGSFLNVVIYRVPEGLSIAYPPSRCPECEHAITWYQNIPVLSYIALRGRCASCRTSISPRYPLIETLTASLFAAAWVLALLGYARAEQGQIGPWWLNGDVTLEGLKEGSFWAIDSLLISGHWEMVLIPFVFWSTFLALLVVISFVDLDHYIIPHVFTIPGMLLGLAFPWVLRWLYGPVMPIALWPPVQPWTSFSGWLAGGLAVMLVYYGYLALRGIEGIGGGDMTLMALIGAWLGWPALPYIFFAGSMQGVLAAGASMLLGARFVRSVENMYLDEEPDQEARQTSEKERHAELAATQKFLSSIDTEDASLKRLGDLPNAVRRACLQLLLRAVTDNIAAPTKDEETVITALRNLPIAPNEPAGGDSRALNEDALISIVGDGLGSEEERGLFLELFIGVNHSCGGLEHSERRLAMQLGNRFGMSDDAVDTVMRSFERDALAVPFGPFLALAAVEFLLFGWLLAPEYAWTWYL